MNIPIPTHARPIVPGNILLHDFLEPLGISQAEFAKHIGFTTTRLNEIIKGKRGITPDTALRLERVLGPSAGFWLNLQLMVDLYDAMHSDSAKTIKRLKPLKQAAA